MKTPSILIVGSFTFATLSVASLGLPGCVFEMTYALESSGPEISYGLLSIALPLIGPHELNTQF